MGSIRKKKKTVDQYEVMWNKMESELESVLKLQPLTQAGFMSLYSDAYNFCTSNRQETALAFENELRKSKLANSSMDCHTIEKMINTGGVLAQKLDMYLKRFLRDLSNALRPKTGDELLQKYNEDWMNYNLNAHVINGALGYLNRKWINNELDENNNSSRAFQIYNLAIDAWRNVVFESTKNTIATEILAGIAKDRVGSLVIDKDLLKTIILSFVHLGGSMNSAEVTRLERGETTGAGAIVDTKTGLHLNLDTYHELIESPLIQSTNDYYTELADEFLTSNPNSFSEYMKMVDTQLQSEEERAQFFLPSVSFQKIVTTCDNVLIRNHVARFQDEFVLFLEQDEESTEDLARIYLLVLRLGNELPILYQAFTEHVTGQGHVAIDYLMKQQKSDTPVSESKFPKVYVESLLEVHQKYKKLIVESFNGNSGFLEALDRACEVFINNNATTESVDNSKKSAELLVRYSDEVLRKSNQSCDDNKSTDDLIQIMTYLSDKDAFQTYYTLRLANRLVRQISSSDDAELLMITKLKLQNGYEYTSKMSRMYQDIVLSKDLLNEFKEKMASDNVAFTHDFQLQILNSGSWPFKNSPIPFSLPQELEPFVQQFTNFYTTKFTGRKLTWFYGRCNGEMIANCFTNKYIFNLSAFHMAVLLMYNNAEEYRLEEIVETTKLSSEIALQVLQTFTNAKVLIEVEAPSSTPESESASDSNKVFKLNQEYNNSKCRVTLSCKLQSEQKLEIAKSESTITQGRDQALQACIVRIMKMNKKMNHKDLVLEVVKQTIKQFQPDESAIRKSIDLLIHKDYLRRTEELVDTYEYIS